MLLPKERGSGGCSLGGGASGEAWGRQHHPQNPGTAQGALVSSPSTVGTRGQERRRWGDAWAQGVPPIPRRLQGGWRAVDGRGRTPASDDRMWAIKGCWVQDAGLCTFQASTHLHRQMGGRNFRAQGPPAMVQVRSGDAGAVTCSYTGVCSARSIQGATGHPIHGDPTPRECTAPLWLQRYQTSGTFERKPATVTWPRAAPQPTGTFSAFSQAVASGKLSRLSSGLGQGSTYRTWCICPRSI